MCGISGCNFHTTNSAIFLATSHRGPDATQWGHYGKFTLGHNRLSIIDLSETANQPFSSADGRYVMVYNGEVYNYLELRRTLQHKYPFRTQSDTEVILYAYIEYGDACLTLLNGMFAFAILDTHTNTIFCARDRLGIKPLVYYWHNGIFIFGSEIKTILKALGTTPALNTAALSQYLRYLYIAAPDTIFEGIKKLMPGNSITLCNQEFKIGQWWNVEQYIGRHHQMTDEQALFELDRLLSDTIERQMIADVPLGSFLSGGIDSSTILHYMAKHSKRKINTFTLGFADAPRYDERSDAALMAKQYATNHTEILISPNAADLLPKMVHHFDEPFGNPTALLIHELTKATKPHVTVALAGDGGDEIFGGYPRYSGAYLYNRVKWMPKPFWSLMGKVLALLGESSTGNHAMRRAKVFVSSLTKRRPDMYDDWVGYFSNAEIEGLTKLHAQYGHAVKLAFEAVPGNDILLQSSICDIHTFMPNNVLAYGDAMSMANGFESRVPLLDHRVVELMTGLPTHMRIRKGRTKFLLKELLKNHLPETIINKPKLGLNPPMGIWLKKDLKELLNNYLSKEAIDKRQLLNHDAVHQLLLENASGKKDKSLHIWALIVLEEWCRQFLD
jgi:asparagine synthase (glutamine-hydrolysing)